MIRETELISLKDGKTKNLTDFVKDLAPQPEPMELTPNTPVDTGGTDPVALSSYIDGIADTSASDAITAGLASGGSIAAAISNSNGWTELTPAHVRTPDKVLNGTTYTSLIAAGSWGAYLDFDISNINDWYLDIEVKISSSSQFRTCRFIYDGRIYSTDILPAGIIYSFSGASFEFNVKPGNSTHPLSYMFSGKLDDDSDPIKTVTKYTIKCYKK